MRAESKIVKKKHSIVLKYWQEDNICPDALNFIKFKIKMSQSPRQFGYLRNMIKCQKSGAHKNKYPLQIDQDFIV